MNTNIWRDFQICISVPLKAEVLLEKGDALKAEVPLENGEGFPNYFLRIPSEKNVFITIGIRFFLFFVW